MKKPFFFILILAGIILFAGTDYVLNTDGAPRIPAKTAPANTSSPVEVKENNFTRNLLTTDSNQYGFVVSTRARVNSIFEKIDLSEVKSIMVFQNQLKSLDTAQDPITIYEIQGPAGQGAITYLNVKLKFIGQVSATQTINEVNNYGQNSFFFNDENNATVGHLVVQIEDNLFGFQYNKENASAFELVQTMINKFVTHSLLNS